MKQLQEMRTLSLLLLVATSRSSSITHNVLRHSTTNHPADTATGTTTISSSSSSRALQTTTCQGDSDCDQLFQYCSKGVCREHGTCDTIVECYNPSNQYFLPACLGYLLCSSDGFCDIECGDSPCPPDSFTVECIDDPCQSQACDSVNAETRCVETFCDGCNAIFFDMAGNQLCHAENNNNTPPTSENTALCASDQDCTTTTQEQQYCRQGECHDVGTCSTFADCLNPANVHDFEEDCLGYQTCSSNDGTCRLECSLGGGAPCPPGLAPVRCLVAPCTVEQCDQVPDARCVDDYCGGCNAYFFDAAGNHVCQKDNDADTLDEHQGATPPCSSDTDCDRATQYCSQGTCQDFGSCTTLSDCLNPSNLYNTPLCIGYKTCDDQGLCGLVCTEDGNNSPCPPGIEQARCLSAPCRVQQCDEFPDARCVNDYCGGCYAYFFDAAGNHVCQQDGLDESEVPGTPCSSDTDCARMSEYCSQGECREFGSCRTLFDCLNPSNLYETMTCEGFKSCENGRCGMTCSDSPCPPGEIVAVCKGLPCNTVSCEADPAARCANYLCGHCQAIFFDTAGNQVCTDDTINESECESDPDCSGENEICVDGSCWVQELPMTTQPPPPTAPTQPPPPTAPSPPTTEPPPPTLPQLPTTEPPPTQAPPTEPPPGTCPCAADLGFVPRFMCVLRNIAVCV